MLANDNVKFGYNAATGKYEDLMAAGIIDPTKVIFALTQLSLFAEQSDDKDLSEHEWISAISGCEMLLGTCSLGCKDILDV